MHKIDFGDENFKTGKRGITNYFFSGPAKEKLNSSRLAASGP